MSEYQAPHYNRNTINEIPDDEDHVQQPAWAASGELGDARKSDIERSISSQLWSNEPKEIATALRETGYPLRYHHTDVFDVAYDIIDKNLDRLVEIAECGEASLELLAMQTIYDAWMGSSQDDPRLISAFKSFLPKIIAHYPESSKAKELPFQPLAQEFIDDFTHPSAINPTDLPLRLSPPNSQPLDTSPRERRKAKLVNGTILDAFGYIQSTVALAEQWQDGMKKTRRKNDTTQAMQVMIALETAQPGTVHSLNESNNIRNFQRYTADMLYQMHRDQIEHPDRDYVLLIQSISDHNNALKRPDTYAKLYDRLKKMGYGLRIYECSELDELDEITEKVLRNYNDHGAQVVSELILAHGSRDSIQLSKYRSLTAHQLDTTIHSNITYAMTRDAWTRFISCSTGKETEDELCIGKEMAIAMGRMAIAPTKNVSFGKMRPIRNGDGVNVMVEYVARQGTKNGKPHYVRSKPATFNGKTSQSQRKPLDDQIVNDDDLWAEFDEVPSESPLIAVTDLTPGTPTDRAFVHLQF